MIRPGRRSFCLLLSMLPFTRSALAVSDANPTAPALHTALQRVSKMRILFGHQSVGGNLIEGIRQLAGRDRVPVNIAETTTLGAVPPGTLGHLRIGKNGDPEGKFKAFAQAVNLSPQGASVSLMKLCYVDFNPVTDAKALFAQYQTTIRGIQSQNPGLTVVHVTAPLTVVQAGPKAWIKRLLGEAPWGMRENQRREEYNTLMRHAYKEREPIFDLALIESTAPDGLQRATEWDGMKVAQLFPGYTDDGSHLNATGQIVAATQLIQFLAQIP